MDMQTIEQVLHTDEETLRRLAELFEEERHKRREAQAAGIARAKAEGVRFGRPCVEVDNLENICEQFLSGELSVSEAAKLAGTSRSTMYRRIQEYRRAYRGH